MAPRWPPSPSVEDEEASLAREHQTFSAVPGTDDDQQAINVGALDQTPVLLHRDDPEPIKSDSEGEAQNELPRRSRQEAPRGSFVPPASEDQASDERGKPSVQKAHELPPLTRANSAKDLDRNEKFKARPHTTRIKTDVQTESHHRYPTRSQASSPTTPRGIVTHQHVRSSDHPEERMLSPNQPPLSPTYQRIASASDSNRWKTYRDDRSRDTTKREYRRHEDRSKSRSARPSIPEEEPIRRPDSGYHSAHSPTSKRPVIHHSSASSEKQASRNSYGEVVSPSHSRKSSTNSEYASATEGLRMTSARDTIEYAFDKSPRDSPNSSAGEDKPGGPSYRSARYAAAEHGPRRVSNSGGERRYYGSGSSVTIKPGQSRHEERPHQQKIYKSDYSRSSRTPPSPVSAQTAQSMQDYFEVAFRDNRTNSVPGRSRPPSPSPTISVPVSPPRTPRFDRTPQDMPASAMPNLKVPGGRLRPTSYIEERSSDLRNATTYLLAAAGDGAAGPNKNPPVLTRSSTASSDATASSHSKTPSGQRSRRPSPLYEEPRPISRHNSTSVKPERPQMLTTDTTETWPLHRTTSYLPEVTRPTVIPSRSISYTNTYGHSGSRSPSISLHSASTSRPPTSSGYSITATSPMTLPDRSTQFPIRSQTFAASAPLPTVKDFALPPCPRSEPQYGYHDWYTIRDMTHMDICPTCMGVLGNTRYRDLFLPSLSKPPNQGVSCAMSKPWLKIGFEQSVKQHRTDLGLLQLLSTTPDYIYPCPGKQSGIRQWFELEDPRTKSAVPNFDVCSDCVRRVERTFPQLRDVFWRSSKKLVTEKLCGLRTHSKHFASILEELERLAQQVGNTKWRDEDSKPLVKHVLRVSRYKECARDSVLASSAWHFMDDLPELTICEDCYYEFVWPMRDRHLAREISRSTKPVPRARIAQQNPGISCQLYSERMRRIFREAFDRNDFRLLKDAVLGRRRAETYVQGEKKRLMSLERDGYNVKAEMNKNLAFWESWE